MARRPKENKLIVRWDEKEQDFIVFYPRPSDGGLAINHLVGDILKYRIPIDDYEYPINYDKTNFKDELEKRGYDVKTLRFEISLKEQ